MIKTLFGVVVFTAVLPVLLSPFISILLEARGTAFFYLGTWMTQGSLLGLSLLVCLVVFISIYRLFIH